MTNDKNYTIAKTDDGTIQITYSIAYSDIKKVKDDVALELGKDLEIPGFRKGNAPLDKILANIPESTLIEKTLSKILPRLFSETIDSEKIKPILFPKFELIKAKENEDWQVITKTAEFPVFNLNNYKETIKNAINSKNILKPGDNKEKVLSREEREQIVIKTLLETISINIPKVLIDEEVQNRFSRILEQIDKLGLTIDTYLTSIGKKLEDIKKEYEKQSKDTLSLDLILSEISKNEKFSISENDINEAVKASSAVSELEKELDNPEKRRLIESILLKRKALNFLTSL